MLHTPMFATIWSCLLLFLSCLSNYCHCDPLLLVLEEVVLSLGPNIFRVWGCFFPMSLVPTCILFGLGYSLLLQIYCVCCLCFHERPCFCDATCPMLSQLFCCWLFALVSMIWMFPSAVFAPLATLWRLHLPSCCSSLAYLVLALLLILNCCQCLLVECVASSIVCWWYHFIIVVPCCLLGANRLFLLVLSSIVLQHRDFGVVWGDFWPPQFAGNKGIGPLSSISNI